MELVFALPILAVLILAAVQYGQSLVMQSGATQAVTVAAREAGKGGNIQDVAQAINRILAVHQVAVTGAPGSGVKIAVQEGSTVTELGDPGVSLPESPAIGPDEICVTLCIGLDAKRLDGKSRIVPSLDLLGFSHTNRQLTTKALVKKEDRRATTLVIGMLY